MSYKGRSESWKAGTVRRLDAGKLKCKARTVRRLENGKAERLESRKA